MTVAGGKATARDRRGARQGRLTDRSGKLLAHATTTCPVFREVEMLILGTYLEIDPIWIV